MPLLRIFCAGLFISFLGTLPLGTLNLLAARMAIEDGVGPAIWFSIGALLVEMIYVRLSLVAMDWIRRQEKWIRVLEWVMIVVILLLAAGSFWSAFHPYRGSFRGIAPGIGTAPIPRLLTGMFLSAVNPLQIPFWFGWSTLLSGKGILQSRRDQYNAYIAGIGLGTFAGNGCFIAGGRLFLHSLSRHQGDFNGVIGVVFVVTAGLQIWKTQTRKDAILPSIYPCRRD